MTMFSKALVALPLLAASVLGDANMINFLSKADNRLRKSDFLGKRGRHLAPIGIIVVGAPDQQYFHGFLQTGDEEMIESIGPFDVYAVCRSGHAAIELRIDDFESDLFIFGSISGDSDGNDDDIKDFVIESGDHYNEDMWKVDGRRGGIDDDTGAFFATDGTTSWYISIQGDTTIGGIQPSSSFDDSSKEDAISILESGGADSDQEDNNCFFVGGLTGYEDALLGTQRRNLRTSK